MDHFGKYSPHIPQVLTGVKVWTEPLFHSLIQLTPDIVIFEYEKKIQ